MRTKEFYIEMFLDYFNNYLTVMKFAADHNLSIDEAKEIISIGRDLNEYAAITKTK